MLNSPNDSLSSALVHASCDAAELERSLADCRSALSQANGRAERNRLDLDETRRQLQDVRRERDEAQEANRRRFRDNVVLVRRDGFERPMFLAPSIGSLACPHKLPSVVEFSEPARLSELVSVANSGFRESEEVRRLRFWRTTRCDPLGRTVYLED